MATRHENFAIVDELKKVHGMFFRNDYEEMHAALLTPKEAGEHLGLLIDEQYPHLRHTFQDNPRFSRLAVLAAQKEGNYVSDLIVDKALRAERDRLVNEGLLKYLSKISNTVVWRVLKEAGEKSGKEPQSFFHALKLLKVEDPRPVFSEHMREALPNWCFRTRMDKVLLRLYMKKFNEFNRRK